LADVFQVVRAGFDQRLEGRATVRDFRAVVQGDAADFFEGAAVAKYDGKTADLLLDLRRCLLETGLESFPRWRRVRLAAATQTGCQAADNVDLRGFVLVKR